MLLRIGVVAIVFSVALTAGVAALVVLHDKAAPQPIPAKPAEALAATPTPRPESRAEPWMEWPEPREEREPRYESKLAPEPEERSEPHVRSQPEPRPEPTPEPAPQPAVGHGWPAPEVDELEAVREHRSFRLVPGAIMSLTIDAIGLRNVPVLNSDSPGALDQGVVHIPETSLPWSPTPQRNVYIAGHRLGYPGTGSRLIFYELDELAPGDEIVLRDRQGQAYRYRVSETFRADPSDSWVMGQVRGRDMLTLQTCTGPGFQKRLIVRADRVEAAAAT